MAKSSKQKGGGCKKAGRTHRKRMNRGKPLSQYVRGVISAEAYWKQIKLKVGR